MPVWPLADTSITSMVGLGYKATSKNRELSKGTSEISILIGVCDDAKNVF